MVALAHKFLNTLTKNVFDESIIPNPFRGLGLGLGLSSGYPSQDDENLYLADSSLSGETLPLWPLIQPSRKLDAIIAVDAAVSHQESLFCLSTQLLIVPFAKLTHHHLTESSQAEYQHSRL